MKKIIYNFAKDFSDSPGGEYIDDGPNSGEQFRKEHLLYAYNGARKLGKKLVINLDGIYGMGHSFIRSAFCEFAWDHPTFLDYVEFEDTESGIAKEVVEQIEEALLMRELWV